MKKKKKKAQNLSLFWLVTHEILGTKYKTAFSSFITLCKLLQNIVVYGLIFEYFRAIKNNKANTIISSIAKIWIIYKHECYASRRLWCASVLKWFCVLNRRPVLSCASDQLTTDGKRERPTVMNMMMCAYEMDRLIFC